MAIQIEQIQIENLGPIHDQKYDLGQVNLFYGENESGKTFLIEFIISSIFRHAKSWQMREIQPAGAVSISGLDQDITRFSPASSRKIEDFWLDAQAGLPLNMSRLLIVKAAELALSDDSPGGVSRADLKNALTGQQLLQGIRKSIPATARDAEIEQGEILGTNRGKLKEKNDIRDDLSKIDSLLAAVDEEYTRGPLKQLEIKRAALQSDLSAQQSAKEHQAFLLWNQYQQLLDQRAGLADDDLLSLRDQIRDYRKIQADLRNIKQRIEDNSPRAEAYRWLTKAIQIWEDLELERKNAPGLFSLVSAGILLLAGSGLLIARELLPQPDLFWPGLAAFVLGIGVSIYYGYSYYQWSMIPAESEERSSLQSAFKQRFGQELQGITHLLHQRGELEKDYHQHDLLTDELFKLEAMLKPAQRKISAGFDPFLDQTPAEKNWEDALDNLTQQAKSLDQDIQQSLFAFTKLNISSDTFKSEEPSVNYDPKKMLDLEESLQHLASEIGDREIQLQNLKNQVCTWTKDDPASAWETALANLYNLRQETAEMLVTLTAELAAMVGLTAVLDQLESEEDQKIVQTINDQRTSQILLRLTGKYQKISLVGDDLAISGGARQFALKDLSTGARDQVQLALRLSMVNHLCGSQPLFLILDDAFQHSDWKRRELLIKEIITTAQEGWQIIYMTMDDHIRELFQTLVKPVFKKDFRYFELE